VRKWIFGFSRNTRLALLAALVLHVFLLTGFLLHSSPKAFGSAAKLRNHAISNTDSAQLQKQAIAAQAVDSAQVNKQVAEIRRLRAKKVKNERMLLRRLQASATKAKKLRQRELASLAKTKRQQKVAAKKLAKSKLQQKIAATQLAQSKRQQKSLAVKSRQTKAAIDLQQRKLAQQQAKAKAKAKAEAKALAAKNLKLSQAKALAVKNSQQGKAKQKAAAKQMSPGQLNYYKSAILAAISQQWVVPASLDKNLSCKLLISLAPGGKVLQVKLIRSSGNSLLDRSAQLAVLKASPLPVPKNTGFFKQFKQLQLTVRPEDFSG
jgi:colicin import membrane protein